MLNKFYKDVFKYERGMCDAIESGFVYGMGARPEISLPSYATMVRQCEAELLKAQATGNAYTMAGAASDADMSKRMLRDLRVSGATHMQHMDRMLIGIRGRRQVLDQEEYQ
jgi:hypothetical protein